MLPALLTTIAEFDSPHRALDYLEDWVTQRFTVPTHDLQIDNLGRLAHIGADPIKYLNRLPLTDVALSHLNALAGIPKSYAAHIEPDLHSHSINDLFKRQVAPVTVVTEVSQKKPESRRVSAVLPGGRFGIDDAVVLKRIASRNLGAYIWLHSGQMDVRFGQATTVEVLPQDAIQISGALRNAHWGLTKVTARPILEVGLYLLRLVCSNGAYAKRALAEGKLMAWATHQQIESFLDQQIDRVLDVQESSFQVAVGIMSNTIPEESECAYITQLITRAVGAQRAEALIGNAVSWWDHVNAVTAAAKEVSDTERQRRLQVEGGAFIERFLV